MKKVVIATLAASALAVAVAASAASTQDQDGWMQRRATGMVVRRIERQLKITDDQRAQIKTILVTETPAIQALANRVKEENSQLASASQFNESDIRAFARAHAGTMEDVLVEREKVRTELLQVLTPEQRQKLQQIREARTGELAQRLSHLADQI
ncbi:MAG: Spy/CpxP family protein refolding chaperone [Acidobacteriaceae bacterium]